jgi:hypothetical protein
MNNTKRLLVMMILVGAFAACSIHVPWEMMDDYDGVRVVMRVTPDDADVLLNGRFIGAAYEFASAAVALRLASRENELVFRKQGFREQVVDLRGYSSRRITVKVELNPAEPGSPAGPAAASETDPAYEAKSEPLPPLPAEKPVPAAERYLTEVALTVTPEETAVYIDDRFWGLAPAPGKVMFLRLPPGKYAFTAFKPGFVPLSREIVVPKQEKLELEITLKK